MARRSIGLAIVALCSGGVGAALAQSFPIGIIDFYGLAHVAPEAARAALAFKEGDTIQVDGAARPAAFAASEAALARLPGVVRARVHVVCCDAGRLILYVGVQERGAPVLRFRQAPRGTARLPTDVLAAGDAFSKALLSAVARGDAGEDDSQGHALAHDAATRAVQEQFIEFARRDPSLLRTVLRTSSEAGHRALAALILGYSADRQAVVDDLVFGMSDPDGGVRNNAMRTLMVFAAAAPGASGVATRVPVEPFVRFLRSPVWSDRNKASFALLKLSAPGDSTVLAELRQSALAPLVEMARWKSQGHALAAFVILGRMAGYTDEAAQRLLVDGRREIVIEAAIRGTRGGSSSRR